MCKACKRYYNQIWYARNADRQRALVKVNAERYRVRLRDVVRQAKSRPCADCGQQYPHYVMDFDHRTLERKLGNIAWMVSRRRTVDDVLAEIAKCEVVCANCHCIRTFQRLGRAQAVMAVEVEWPTFDSAQT
jgi:hypothetical protein